MELLRLVHNNEMCVTDLVKNTKLSQPKVSMILKELRDLKLLNIRIVGKNRFYSTNKVVVASYINDIKKIISDFDVNNSFEIIVRR